MQQGLARLENFALKFKKARLCISNLLLPATPPFPPPLAWIQDLPKWLACSIIKYRGVHLGLKHLKAPSSLILAPKLSKTVSKIH